MTPLFFGGLIAVASLVLGLYGGKECARWRIAREMKTTPVAQLEPGMAEVVGRIASDDHGQMSPMTQRPCVYYHLTVHEMRRLSRTRVWRVVLRDKKWSPCWLEDETGRIRIDLGAADVLTEARVTVHSGLLNDAPPHLGRLLRERHRVSTQSWGFNRKLRFRETVVESGKELFALGRVVIDEEGPRLTGGGRIFAVSDSGKAPIVHRYMFKTLGLGILSIGAAAASLLILGPVQE